MEGAKMVATFGNLIFAPRHSTAPTPAGLSARSARLLSLSIKISMATTTKDITTATRDVVTTVLEDGGLDSVGTILSGIW